MNFIIILNLIVVLVFYHNTIPQMYTFECQDCGEDLHLDPNVVSKSGKKIPLDYNDNPHDCPEREKDVWESEPFNCNGCGADIYVSDRLLSKNGKRIPINSSDNQAHQCPNPQSKPFPCKDCKQMIVVSSTVLSKNGKKVPLSASTGSPHQCRNKKPYYGSR